MTVTDAPKIITSRFDQADAHTLAGYRRTAGPEDAYPTVVVYPAGADVGSMKVPNR